MTHSAICARSWAEVFKWQEGFWQIMKEVFDADYKAWKTLASPTCLGS